MRVNIYDEEITDEIVVVTRQVQQGPDLVTFHGVRAYLLSHPSLSYTPDDDDRSAVTFWIPVEGKGRLRDLFRQMDTTLGDVPG